MSAVDVKLAEQRRKQQGRKMTSHDDNESINVMRTTTVGTVCFTWTPLILCCLPVTQVAHTRLCLCPGQDAGERHSPRARSCLCPTLRRDCSKLTQSNNGGVPLTTMLKGSLQEGSRDDLKKALHPSCGEVSLWQSRCPPWIERRSPQSQSMRVQETLMQ